MSDVNAQNQSTDSGIKVTNDTLDVTTLKMCLYNTQQIGDVIPIDCFNVPSGQSATWFPNPAQVREDYAVRGFKPAIFDRLLFRINEAELGENFIVTGSRRSGYSVERTGESFQEFEVKTF